jgi:hypothetical protein
MESWCAIVFALALAVAFTIAKSSQGDAVLTAQLLERARPMVLDFSIVEDVIFPLHQTLSNLNKNDIDDWISQLQQRGDSDSIEYVQRFTVLIHDTIHIYDKKMREAAEEGAIETHFRPLAVQNDWEMEGPEKELFKLLVFFYTPSKEKLLKKGHQYPDLGKKLGFQHLAYAVHYNGTTEDDDLKVFTLKFIDHIAHFEHYAKQLDESAIAALLKNIGNLQGWMYRRWITCVACPEMCTVVNL